MQEWIFITLDMFSKLIKGKIGPHLDQVLTPGPVVGGKEHGAIF